MFKIVVPMYNVDPWLADSLGMLKRQSIADFHCILIDDCSTDDTVAVARQLIAGDSRFDLVCNSDKQYALGNVVVGIERLDPAPDDVIVVLDGDDRLLVDDALERVAAVYADKDCWVTYGSFTSRDDGLADASCQPYPPDVVSANRFRTFGWCGMHPRTFRAHLWRHMDAANLRTTAAELENVVRSQLLNGHPRLWWQLRQLDWRDLLDPSARWFRRCCDKAVMYPLLELSGPRAVFIPDILYWYQSRGDRMSGRGADRRQRFIQRAIRAIVSSRQPLQPLATSAVETAPMPDCIMSVAVGARGGLAVSLGSEAVQRISSNP